jgi:16S rRNA processing protein RimM
MRGAERVEIGGIARAHGIRGEVVVHTHDPESEILGDVELIFVGGVARKILEARDTHKGWLVALEGVATRNDADALALDAGDVLLDDLIGCRVVLPDGRPWGTIASVEIGPQDLLVIHDGDVERLLPLVDELVPHIDIANGVVTVDPPEGLPETKR